MSDAPPTRFRPQLAQLVKTVPTGPEWVHEIKYDGYRIGCRIAGNRRARAGTRDVTLYSRNNKDWTAVFPEIVSAAAQLPVKSALLDGEVAILLPDGRTSFQALQNALTGRARHNLVYFVFDLLFLDGDDLCGLPLEDRKARLKALLAGRSPRIKYSDHVAGDASALLKEACRLQLEGIVSKRRDLPYHAGRHDGWLKTKCTNRQEFVIGGFTDPEGSRQGIGALLVGYYEGETEPSARRGADEDPGRFIFAGKVGTGFTNKSSVDIRKRLEAIARQTTPFAAGLDTWLARHAHWVRPDLVAEVTFTEWTGDGKIRHPSFQGLRADKRPTEIRRERPASPASSEPAESRAPGDAKPRAARRGRIVGAELARPADAKSSGDVVRGVQISHPDRVMYPDVHLTKLDVVRYYETIAERMLPHVLGRPLTLVRCGSGLTSGEMRRDCIYMKHSKVWSPPGLRRVNIRERTKVGEYLIVESVESLIGLAQMDILELHTWNSTFDQIEAPNRLVIDIDPGPDVPWSWVVDAARLVRSVLQAVELESFPKTTGGAGLHVVAPLVPSRSWHECLEFSRQVASAIVRTDPGRYTVTFAKQGRERKLLIDYLRNNRTNTSIAAFSTRARPGAPVSLPIAWDEVTPRLRPARFTAQSVPRMLSRNAADPWKDYWTTRQKITTRAVRAIERI